MQQQKKSWVVMGVSACGKSEIGRRLAAALDLPFIEGDDFHPAGNVAKMSAGIPLTDADRAGWLLTLQAKIAAARINGSGLVLSCSALKRCYRDVLRGGDAALGFAHLAGARDVLAARMTGRAGHFMPLNLLDSQLATLQPLQSDETGITLDLEQQPDRLIAEIIAWGG
ncbi:gluconokinase [Janthinobacterium agaricidamnosum]|uniref:Gluconokinase n=1 Tax=Janthinobacterium agaricidamnosum NBRC 102515 = DSM 9628 TaxID=1349767 RepID=W0V3Y0_9BURK|nr:gluconokinase [Janthinobacterium agaricidamnosum]CDG83534.1 carbohydrate kinase, thermoresistant glucokinase family protein [Janthinobacterium agaricidamnosum NBRC 102515 = DSM 9628]